MRTLVEFAAPAHHFYFHNTRTLASIAVITTMTEISQRSLFDDEPIGESDVARRLLDQLLADSRLYKDSESYKQLLVFVAKLRNVAPFNAMLLQVQKPGTTYVASAYDWETRFGRRPKEWARPLLILWPFGPMATVYDFLDTEGEPLPEDAFAFPASGEITDAKIRSFKSLLASKNIEWEWVDTGDASAGRVRIVERGNGKDKGNRYRIMVNRNHDVAIQFTTIAHELGHLFLGHLGSDNKLDVPIRRPMNHAEIELEAESVAYLVCERNGVHSKSEIYLSHFVKSDTNAEKIDVYQIMRAAGQVETLLKLTSRTKFNRPSV
jgi:hypothetical protein